MFKAHIKLIVLKELCKNNLTGYDLMKLIGEFGDKPSPGYIYPLLNDLEKKKFISVKKDERKKVYSITKNGMKLLEDLEKNREEMIDRMKKSFSPLIDKKDLEGFVQTNVKMHKHHVNFKERILLEKLHKAIYTKYESGDLVTKEKIKEILMKTIKEIEEIK